MGSSIQIEGEIVLAREGAEGGREVDNHQVQRAKVLISLLG